jgi:uncharacterized protein with HEPN domain
MAAGANPRARLEHILFHIRGVADTVGGIRFDAYTSVYHMERTVERAVQIISEAVRALPRELTQQYPEIEWDKIAGIGNILRHEFERWTPKRCGISPPSSCWNWKLSSGGCSRSWIEVASVAGCA